MKTKIFELPYSKILAVFLFACAIVTMPCMAKNQQKSLKPFNAIIVVGNTNTEVMLHQSAEYKIEISGAPFKKTQIEISDSSLWVSTMGIDSTAPLRLDIWTPTYRQIDCSFVSMLLTDSVLETSDLQIRTVASDINVGIHASYFQLESSDGRVVVRGVCEQANVNFNGGEKSLLNATYLLTNQLTLDAGVLNDIYVNVADSLWLTNGISCQIHVTGMPAVPQINLVNSELHLSNKTPVVPDRLF